MIEGYKTLKNSQKYMLNIARYRKNGQIQEKIEVVTSFSKIDGRSFSTSTLPMDVSKKRRLFNISNMSLFAKITLNCLHAQAYNDPNLKPE